MQGLSSYEFYKGFRFESFWINIDGFFDVVQQAWSTRVNTSNSVLRLHVKMIRTAKGVFVWDYNLGRLYNLTNCELTLSSKYVGLYNLSTL
jgi:hypothetical protein